MESIKKESSGKEENRADAFRVLLALGVLALLSSLDDAGTKAPPIAQVESALSR